MLTTGQKAPDFDLINTKKERVNLETFKGKNLVLFFFPMAWTGTCTKEVCVIQEDFSWYTSLNTVVAGVSVDTLFALKRYAEDYKLDFPMLSDFNKTAIHDYGVVHHQFGYGYKDVAMRATFLIDNDGILRYQEILPSLGDFPDMAALKSAINQIS